MLVNGRCLSLWYLKPTVSIADLASTMIVQHPHISDYMFIESF